MVNRNTVIRTAVSIFLSIPLTLVEENIIGLLNELHLGQSGNANVIMTSLKPYKDE